MRTRATTPIRPSMGLMNDFHRFEGLRVRLTNRLQESRRLLGATLGIILLVVVASVASGSWQAGVAAIAAFQLGTLGLLIRGSKRLSDNQRESAKVYRAIGRELQTTLSEVGKIKGDVGRALQEASAIQQRVRTVLTEIEETRRQIHTSQGAAYELLTQNHRALITHAFPSQTGEIEALLQLYARFSPVAPMPTAGGWALNATDLLAVIDLVDRYKPRLIVELGSGASSIWLGYAVKAQSGRVVSIEHDATYASETRGQLARHGLEGPVEVRDAPLSDVGLPDHVTPWYDPDAFGDLMEIDLLIVDGPPGRTGPLARYPAIPILRPRLAKNGLLALDDAHRDDERRVLERWCSVASELHPISIPPATSLKAFIRQDDL